MAARLPPNTTVMSGISGHPWMTFQNLVTTIQPIEESARMVRSWNATLHNLAAPEFRQRRITVSSTDDMLPPALDGLFPGQKLTITPDMYFMGGGTQFDRAGNRVREGMTPVAPVYSYGRKSFRVMVKEPFTLTESARDKRISWTLTCEEWESATI